MHTIETATIIDATPDAIWASLVDFDAYADWNPFITAAEGTAANGERLRIRVEPPDSRAGTFKPVVTAAVPGERLEWVGRLGVRGLFDGRHEFRIEPSGDGRSRLVQRESFSGLLVGLLLDEPTLRRGFEAMNEALRTRVENEHCIESEGNGTGVPA